MRACIASGLAGPAAGPSSSSPILPPLSPDRRRSRRPPRWGASAHAAKVPAFAGPAIGSSSSWSSPTSSSPSSSAEMSPARPCSGARRRRRCRARHRRAKRRPRRRSPIRSRPAGRRGPPLRRLFDISPYTFRGSPRLPVPRPGRRRAAPDNEGRDIGTFGGGGAYDSPADPAVEPKSPKSTCGPLDISRVGNWAESSLFFVSRKLFAEDSD